MGDRWRVEGCDLNGRSGGSDFDSRSGRCDLGGRLEGHELRG